MEPMKKSLERWTDDEVQVLLCIYAEEEIQREFESTARNDKVYAKMAARLAEMNINHTVKQVREKLKKLKQDYKKVKDHNNRSGTEKRSKWYDRLDALLGHKPAYSGSAATTQPAMLTLGGPKQEYNTESNDTDGKLSPCFKTLVIFLQTEVVVSLATN